MASTEQAYPPGCSPEQIAERRARLPPAVFLLGDSITHQGSLTNNLCPEDRKHNDRTKENGEVDGIVAGFGHVLQLQEDYRGKAIVLNWGYSGWSTDMVVRKLPEMIPPRDKVRIDTVFIEFGANCSSTWVDPNKFPGASPDQSVAPSRQVANLVEIVEYIREHHDDPHIAIVTVPSNRPVRMGQCQSERHRSHGEDVPEDDIPVNRSTEQARIFSELARKAAQEAKVGVVDLFAAFIKAGGENNPQLDVDGLHLSNRGYRIFYNAIVDFIRQNWPGKTSDQLPVWDGIEAVPLPTAPDLGAWRDIGAELHKERFDNLGISVPGAEPGSDDHDYHFMFEPTSGRNRPAADKVRERFERGAMGPDYQD